MARTRITASQFGELTEPLLGLTISRPWRGHGSALFLELGGLHREAVAARTRRFSILRGQATIMMQWSWRIERVRSIEPGSWCTDRRLEHAINCLKGARITAMDVVGRLPELVLTLSGGRWIHSFMTAEGQPQWVVFLPDDSWLTVERGAVIHDTQNQRRRVKRTIGAT